MSVSLQARGASSTHAGSGAYQQHAAALSKARPQFRLGAAKTRRDIEASAAVATDPVSQVR